MLLCSPRILLSGFCLLFLFITYHMYLALGVMWYITEWCLSLGVHHQRLSQTKKSYHTIGRKALLQRETFPSSLSAFLVVSNEVLLIGEREFRQLWLLLLSESVSTYPSFRSRHSLFVCVTKYHTCNFRKKKIWLSASRKASYSLEVQ